MKTKKANSTGNKVKTPKIKLVKSKDYNGCAVACIATVLGVTYDDVVKDFTNNFNENGLALDKTASYLSDRGCQIIRKTLYSWNKLNFAHSYMLEPFAPIHIVRIEQYFDSEFGHVLVMDKDGKLYCPNAVDGEYARKAYSITDVLGIFRK